MLYKYMFGGSPLFSVQNMQISIWIKINKRNLFLKRISMCFWCHFVCSYMYVFHCATAYAQSKRAPGISEHTRNKPDSFIICHKTIRIWKLPSLFTTQICWCKPKQIIPNPVKTGFCSLSQKWLLLTQAWNINNLVPFERRDSYLSIDMKISQKYFEALIWVDFEKVQTFLGRTVYAICRIIIYIRYFSGALKTHIFVPLIFICNNTHIEYKAKSPIDYCVNLPCNNEPYCALLSSITRMRRTLAHLSRVVRVM